VARLRLDVRVLHERIGAQLADERCRVGSLDGHPQEQAQVLEPSSAARFEPAALAPQLLGVAREHRRRITGTRPGKRCLEARVLRRRGSGQKLGAGGRADVGPLTELHDDGVGGTACAGATSAAVARPTAPRNAAVRPNATLLVVDAMSPLL